MKKYFLLLEMLLITNAYSEQLQTYSQIRDAVSSGKQVRIYTDLSNCTGDHNQQNEPNFSNVYTPNEIIINNQAGYMTASLMHFTLNHPQFSGQPVYEFTRYMLANTGELTLSMTALNAANYSPIAAKITFHCKMNESARFYI